jgi:hypothetical protein
MAIKMFHDSACTQEVTAANPDLLRQAVESGEDLTEDREFWLRSDDNTLTYENITITASGDSNSPTTGEVDIKYSLSNENYEDEISLPNSDFSDPVKIWRRVHSPNVTFAFNVTTIAHKITAEEYLK